MGKFKGRAAQVLKRQRRQSLRDCHDEGHARQELVKLAAAASADAAVTKWDKARKATAEEWRDCRLRNTKLLLRHYRSLKVHCENAVFDAGSIDTENAVHVLELMEVESRPHMYVESIKKSAERTYIIMSHVDKMLQLYQIYCESSGKPEDRWRYNVLNTLYISDTPMSVSEIAVMEGVEERTVYRDVNAAIKGVTTLLFGIDGLSVI